MLQEMKKDKMPFTGHCAKELLGVIEWLKSVPLPVECLDAFLHEYKKTEDLDKAIFFLLVVNGMFKYGI